MRRSLAACVLILLTSCASFHSKKVPLSKAFDGRDLKVSEVVEVRISQRFFAGKHGRNSSTDINVYGDYGIDEIKGVTICSKQPCPQKKDKTILMDVYYGQDGSTFLAFLSGITLTVIPTKFRELFYVKALVLDGEGRMLKKYELEDHVTTWIQALLVLGLPFRDYDIMNKVARNLVNEVLVLASKDGLI